MAISLSGTLATGRIIRGALTDGSPIKVVAFTNVDTINVTHNRHRVLQSVKVFITLSAFGAGGFNEDDFGSSDDQLEELDEEHYTVTYTNSDSFIVTLDNVYTGEIRFS